MWPYCPLYNYVWGVADNVRGNRRGVLKIFQGRSLHSPVIEIILNALESTKLHFFFLKGVNPCRWPPFHIFCTLPCLRNRSKHKTKSCRDHSTDEKHRNITDHRGECSVVVYQFTHLATKCPHSNMCLVQLLRQPSFIFL